MMPSSVAVGTSTTLGQQEGASAEQKTPITRRISLMQVLIYPVLYWNWKTATINAGIRGSFFLLAVGRHGGWRGVVVEIVYVVFNTGFFCAIQQGLLAVRPRWAGRLGIVVGVPVAAQACDWLVHIAARAPNPRGFTIGMLAFSLLSAAFHLHLMESGAMLMGSEGKSFLSDLKALPRLVVSFVCVPFTWAAQAARGLLSLGKWPQAEWEPGPAE